MSKKFTRKSIALGTAVAFGASAFAGSVPASADGPSSLSLVPYTGTGYSTLNNFYSDDYDKSSIFILKTNFVNPPTGKNVLYKVENLSESNIQWEFAETGEDDNAEDAFWRLYDDVYWDSSDWYPSYDGNSSNDEFYINEGVDTSDSTAYLGLATTEADEDVSIKVTAFYDVNGSGDLDNEEGAKDIATSTRTINFFTPATAKPKVNLIQPVWGDDTLTAQMTFGQTDINSEMLADISYWVEDDFDDQMQPTIEFRNRDAGNSWSSWDDRDVFWDTSDDELGLIATVSYAADGEARVAARSALWDEYNDEYVYSSEDSYRSITEPVASYVELEPVLGANVTDTPDHEYEYGVRTETKNVAFEATVFDDSDDEVGAGVPVTVTVYDNGLEAGSTITGGGKTLKSTGDNSIEFQTTTNKDGIAAFSLTSNKGTEDDEIQVEVTVDDVDGGTDSDSNYLIWENGVFDRIEETSEIDYDNYTNRNITKGGSYTLNYVVLDQFNELTSTDDGDDLRVFIWDNSSDFDVDKSKPVSGGKVSFNVTDDSEDVVADYEVYAQVYADFGSSVSSRGDYITTDIYVNEKTSAAEFYDIQLWGSDNSTDAMDPADLSDSDVYDTDSVYGDVSYEDFATGKHYESVDFGDLNGYYDGLEYIEWGSALDLGLYVADANGDDLPGAKVSVSAPGLLVQDYGQELQASLGTYSAPADDTGWFEINLYSHKSGLFPVTITSGSAKITFMVAFKVDKDDVSSADVTLSLSKTPVWGKDSIDVKAVVGDKFGNGISGEDVDFSKSGFGFLDETTATTDSNGIARVTLVGGTSGTTTINAETDDSFDKETAKKTIFWWNKTASATEGAKAGKVLVYGSASVGDKVVVKIDGKRVAAFNAATKRFSYTVKGATAGTRWVVVKINGKKVFHDALTVN